MKRWKKDGYLLPNSHNAAHIGWAEARSAPWYTPWHCCEVHHGVVTKHTMALCEWCASFVSTPYTSSRAGGALCVWGKGGWKSAPSLIQTSLVPTSPITNRAPASTRWYRE